MTTYRLFPSTNGPATPASYSGPFLAGVVFSIKQNASGTWFNGYWMWVCASGQATTGYKCALWSVTGTAAGMLVPGSVVTAGTLTAGQWNFIPLPTPIQLAPGFASAINANETSSYIAAIGWSTVGTTGFPDSNGFWTTPIDNGPLHAYDGNHAGSAAGAPWSQPQGVFSTAGTDPSVNMPSTASGTDNFWVDVQVSDTAPAGYAGSYRLWPNKGDANPVSGGDQAINFTVATEIHLSETCTLDNVWYFSPNGTGTGGTATTLATRCDVWNISTGLSVASITSPSWKTPSGGAASAGSGWVKAAFAGGTTLPAGSYRVSIYNANGSTDANWNSKDGGSDYFGETVAGVGAGGLTWGPVSAPGYASAASGFKYGGAGSDTPPWSSGGTAVPHAQPVFYEGSAGATGVVGFPQLFANVNTNETSLYWVDLEVTPVAAPGGPKLLMASLP